MEVDTFTIIFNGSYCFLTLRCHSFTFWLFYFFRPKRIIFSSPVQIHISMFLMCLFVFWIWILVWFAVSISLSFLESQSTIGSQIAITCSFEFKENSKIQLIYINSVKLAQFHKHTHSLTTHKTKTKKMLTPHLFLVIVFSMYVSFFLLLHIQAISVIEVAVSLVHTSIHGCYH